MDPDATGEIGCVRACVRPRATRHAARSRDELHARVPTSHVVLLLCRRCRCDAFASALYTLSLQHREVSPRSLYAVFPDSDFRNDNTTNSFMWKRKLWSVRA